MATPQEAAELASHDTAEPQRRKIAQVIQECLRIYWVRLLESEGQEPGTRLTPRLGSKRGRREVRPQPFGIHAMENNRKGYKKRTGRTLEPDSVSMAAWREGGMRAIEVPTPTPHSSRSGLLGLFNPGRS